MGAKPWARCPWYTVKRWKKPRRRKSPSGNGCSDRAKGIPSPLGFIGKGAAHGRSAAKNTLRPGAGLPADGGEHRGGEALPPEVLRHRHALHHILLEGGGGGDAARAVPEEDGIGHIPLPTEALFRQELFRVRQGPAPEGAVLQLIVSVRHGCSSLSRCGVNFLSAIIPRQKRPRKGPVLPGNTPGSWPSDLFLLSVSDIIICR